MVFGTCLGFDDQFHFVSKHLQLKLYRTPMVFGSGNTACWCVRFISGGITISDPCGAGVPTLVISLNLRVQNVRGAPTDTRSTGVFNSTSSLWLCQPIPDEP